MGFSSDGANTLVGCRNSVWTRLKAISPNGVQLKCVCHSLALCIQQAVSKLPSNIGLLLCEVPSWFSNSKSRQKAYKQLFIVMNTESANTHSSSQPLPFQKVSLTRWLVRGKVMYNLLISWETLKAYFTCFKQNYARYEVKYKARMIKEMLSDYKNDLYVVFATPIVQEFERVNSLF